MHVPSVWDLLLPDNQIWTDFMFASKSQRKTQMKIPSFTGSAATKNTEWRQKSEHWAECSSVFHKLVS